MECDCRAAATAATAPFNAADTIKDSSLNDVGLDGRRLGSSPSSAAVTERARGREGGRESGERATHLPLQREAGLKTMTLKECKKCQSEVWSRRRSLLTCFKLVITAAFPLNANANYCWL